jgi:hypothetical protein
VSCPWGAQNTDWRQWDKPSYQVPGCHSTRVDGITIEEDLSHTPTAFASSITVTDHSSLSNPGT